jgi:hypothetical protein
MGILSLTSANIKFIKANRLVMSASDMARHFGVGKDVVGRYMRKNKLTAPQKLQLKLRSEAMKKRTTSDKKTDCFLKKNYLKINVNQLSINLGRSETFVKTRLRQLGLVIPKEIIENRKKDSRIKPGNIPFNKGKKQSEYMTRSAIKRTAATRFKRGNLPHNSIGVKDGDISIRVDHKNRDGKAYKYIRVELGKWYPLHQHKWERKNGKLPRGKCLWFRDGNTMNCTLKNLELITRAENMRRNSASYNLTDGYVAQTIAGKNGRHLFEDVKANKDLIEVKRLQILINRQIKKHEQKN